MNKLSPEQLDQLDRIVIELRKSKETIKDRFDSVNGVINVLNEEIEHYNQLLIEAQDFRNAVAETIEGDWADKPEEWFESTAGEEQASWKEEWDQTYPEEIDTVAEVELESLKHDEELLSLPQSA